MRRLFLPVALAMATFVLPCQPQTPTHAKSLSTEELKKLVDEKTEFFFLDVREPKELEELGTLKGYVNIPLSQLEQRLSEIPKDVLIVTA